MVLKPMTQWRLTIKTEYSNYIKRIRFYSTIEGSFAKHHGYDRVAHLLFNIGWVGATLFYCPSMFPGDLAPQCLTKRNNQIMMIFVADEVNNVYTCNQFPAYKTATNKGTK